MAIILGAVLTGCVDTEGNLKIKGKVIDEFTKEPIAGKHIIVQGLPEAHEKLIPIEVAQFSTDSSGFFEYTMQKVRDVRYYNFSLVGDSDYTFVNRRFGLYELEQNSKYLLFSLPRLTDLTIIIKRSKNPVRDTLSLSWETNGVSGRSLYAFKINNFADTAQNFGITVGKELRWTGGNVNSIVKTKVFADKRTKLRWDLDRNGKRKEITDTITCKRNRANTVYFTY
jgi:hypothetical protein